MRQLPDHEQKIVDYFADIPHVQVVYLYGSFTTDRVTPHSDVDIGVLYPFGQEPSVWTRLQMAEELAERLGRRVDLVDLYQASPVLGMQVLRYGKLLLCRDRGAANAWFVRTTNFYNDLKISRRVIEQNLGKVRVLGRS